MRAFKDNAGRSWDVSLNVMAIKRIKTLVGFDLLAAVDDQQQFAAFLSNMILMVDCLYVVCQSQCQSRGVNDEAFGEAIAGDTLGAAMDCLLDEIVDFFPNPRRSALAKVIATARKIQATATEKALAQLDVLTAEALSGIPVSVAAEALSV